MSDIYNIKFVKRLSDSYIIKTQKQYLFIVPKQWGMLVGL